MKSYQQIAGDGTTDRADESHAPLLSIDAMNTIIYDAITEKHPKPKQCTADEGDDHRQMRDQKFSDLCNTSTAWNHENLNAEDFRARCDAWLETDARAAGGKEAK